MKIAISLSGGGFRAVGFHLGVLARLAEQNQFENITLLSTVSGGSLCIGLVFALNGFSWPSSREFLHHVVPAAQHLLTSKNLEVGLLSRVLRSPWRILDTKADDLSYLLRKVWGITISLDELPEHPRWMINATCYETGKNWRFERFRMGDYVFGYTYDTKVPLSDAIAASAGFPGLIGPLAFDTRAYRWFRYADQSVAKALTLPDEHRAKKTQEITPDYAKIHLWDGGVYDNHGLEGIHDFMTGWRQDVEFFIISDASAKASSEAYRRGLPALLRIINGIMMDQIRSLRSRAILERILNHEDPGAFIQIGNTCEEVLRASKRQDFAADICSTCMSAEQATLAAMMGTRIGALSADQFEHLFRHGFEVADYTLQAHSGDLFGYIGYQNVTRA